MDEAVKSTSPPARKRRRGDGLWLDTRSPGRPVWCIRYKGLDGKHHRERTEAQTREQAMALLAQRTGELFKARIVGVHSLERLKPVTFADYVEREYLPAKAPPARRLNTHDRDLTLYSHLKPTFGQLTLGAVDVQELNRYFAKRKHEKTYKGTPPSPAQLNRERQFLNAVLNMALMSGLLDRNPVQCIKKLREDNARDRVLSSEEESSILGQSPAFLAPVMTLALHTGMRLGEIVNLKWSDIDRKEGSAVLGGFIRVGHESKGHRSRHVPINSAVKAALDAQKPVAGPEGFVPFVFVNERFEKPYSPLSAHLGSNNFEFRPYCMSWRSGRVVAPQEERREAL